MYGKFYLLDLINFEMEREMSFPELLELGQVWALQLDRILWILLNINEGNQISLQENDYANILFSDTAQVPCAQ